MIVLEEGVNNVQLSIAFFNNNNDYLLRIEDNFKQYTLDVNLTDMSNNKNLYTEFELEVVTDINDQDLINGKIFLNINKRYFYYLFDSFDNLIDTGYLIYT